MVNRAQIYFDAIFYKAGGLDRVLGFIDGTVIGIRRPKSNVPQQVVYNGHKRKHALKF